MASNALKPSLLRSVAKRGYAAQASTQQSSFSLPSHEPKVTALPSGAVVASLETNAPVSRLAILFKAGSRYEQAKNLGASHTLRACVGLGTKNKSAFNITRTVQQAGGALSCESGREHIHYGMDIIRDSVDTGLDILGEVSLHPGLKTWELGDNLRRIKDELATVDPSTLAIDLLHKASYRNSGLGNSLFVPNHHLGKLAPELLGDFHASTHTASRMAIVGLGVDHGTLVSFANGLGLSSASGASTAATVSGGEIRHETGAPVTVVAVAGPGASIGTNDAAALAVAQHILGVGPGTKRGSAASNILAGSVAASGGLGSASALNVNYSDGGLFGYFVIADSASVGKVVSSVHSAVKGLKVSDADVARAKNQVKAAILMATESSAAAIEDMGLQALLTGAYRTPTAAAAAVDSVTAGTVNAALSKALGGKLSMSAVGSMASVPYLDQM
ncbi:Cytochrome b-c1 complex subunit 2, mitochondrial [Halocaridina rubra]|uniref:Cytochrome b-c1 complex subunit 2, mitochondrial n=1 Tax=Halocaridina rubra TaxID=373956 RepID=A0AAN8XCE7_HALRR